MKVLYFGTYSKEEGYPRNNIIIKGLRQNGVEVIECHVPLWKETEERMAVAMMGMRLLRFLPRLFLAYLTLLVRFLKVGRYDLIIVGYPGYMDIFLTRLLNAWRRRPIVFDAFLSLYETVVLDRRVVREGSLRGKILWWIDKVSCNIADLVLLDTEEHIRFFVETFGLSGNKFCRVFVGADEMGQGARDKCQKIRVKVEENGFF